MYTMSRNNEERMGVKKKDYKRNNKTSGNRRIQKIHERAKRHKNDGCANCKQNIPQKNWKKSNMERVKNTKTVKNKS